MTIHETRTHLSPAEVVERARTFFTLGGSPYAAFPERAGEGHLRLEMEAGEIVIGAVRQADSTRVRGTASRGAHLLALFLTTLASPLEAGQTMHRHGRRETRAARTSTFERGTAARPAASPPQPPVGPVPQAA